MTSLQGKKKGGIGEKKTGSTKQPSRNRFRVHPLEDSGVKGVCFRPVAKGTCGGGGGKKEEEMKRGRHIKQKPGYHEVLFDFKKGKKVRKGKRTEKKRRDNKEERGMRRRKESGAPETISHKKCGEAKEGGV